MHHGFAFWYMLKLNKWLVIMNNPSQRFQWNVSNGYKTVSQCQCHDSGVSPQCVVDVTHSVCSWTNTRCRFTVHCCFNMFWHSTTCLSDPTPEVPNLWPGVHFWPAYPCKSGLQLDVTKDLILLSRILYLFYFQLFFVLDTDDWCDPSTTAPPSGP